MLKLYVKAQTLWEGLKDERGQDLIEYALLGTAIAVGAVAFLPGFVNALANIYTNMTSTVSGA